MKSIPGFVRLMLVLLLVGLLNGPSPAQAPANPATRFRAVEGYSLFITVDADEDMKVSHQLGSLEQKFKEHFTARIDLPERHLDNDYVEWTGEGVAEQNLEQERKEVDFNGNFVHEVKTMGRGNSQTKVRLYIDELKRTFQVSVDTEYIPGTLSGYQKNLNKTEQISGDTSLVTTGLRWLNEEYPLPGEGLGLMVDKPFPKEQCGVYLQNMDWLNVHKDHAHLGRIQIDLEPLGVTQPKLILTPPDDYETWRPKPPLESSPESTPEQPVSVAGIDSRSLSPKLPLRIQYASLLPVAFPSPDQPQLGLDPSDPSLVRPTPFPFDVGWEIVPADTKVAIITFELSGVSHYPGWCMNWPKDPESGSEPDFDLKFVSLPTYGDHTLTPPFQTLTLNDVSGNPSSPFHSGLKGTIRLGSLDGAAIGVLTARAILADGRPIKTEIKGKASSQRLLIPDREEGVSEIAKDWRKNHAGDRKDEDDDEEKPEGDGQVGDGLTVWEEYRGFYQGGQWSDNCDPRKKDLFIENTVGASAKNGIDLFGNITGVKDPDTGEVRDQLVIHDQLTDREHKSKVINFNKRKDRWVADQHCILLAVHDVPMEGMAYPERHVFQSNHSGPPKNTDRAEVPLSKDILFPSYDPDTGKNIDRSENNAVVAHELCHAIGIDHHGDKDVYLGVEWTWRKYSGSNKSLMPAYGFFENGTPISVLQESNLRPVTIEQVFGSTDTTRKVWVGRWSGQHSGNWDCVMRYNVAQAYENSKDLTRGRIWHGLVPGEPPGIILCNSPAGTGLNYPTHPPQSRYGPADAGRGDCKHQFVISDRWDGPRRRALVPHRP